MKKYFLDKKGFTLMEIMVVIVIMGILAVAAMGSFIPSQRKSRDMKRKGDLAGISKALELFYNDNGSYPLGNNGLIAACNNALEDCDWGTGRMENADELYMATIPKDPKRNFEYYYLSDGTHFQLYAKLENMEDAAILVDDNPTYYSDTDCGDDECNYGISSTNTAPEIGHDRTDY